MSAVPIRLGTKPEIDDETRRVVEERLATCDMNPKQDYRDALADAVREGRKEIAQLTRPVAR